MIDFNEMDWYTDDPQDYMQRSILLCMFASAGYEVYHETQNRGFLEKWPFLVRSIGGSISGLSEKSLDASPVHKEYIPYEKVYEELQRQIKENETSNNTLSDSNHNSGILH